jgi:DMSO/TMAO reductase YedYZ molybdopterin-dependent catalytic subunit
MKPLTRRRLITSGAAVTAGAAGLTAASRIAARYGILAPDHCGFYGPGEALTYAAQRILAPNAHAREFSRGMISKTPFANEAPALTAWRLEVSGLVSQKLSLSLADLRALSTRNQITEVACEEGWSYIAEWIGTPLSDVLSLAGMQPQARFLVYYAYDGILWDSIDITEALHPQTLLTWGMNDGDLPVSFGGPLRLRVPRQLGYKSVKYINRIIATDNIKAFGQGLGSLSPEFGYSWYAGI